MNEIKLIPSLEASDFPNEVEEEFIEAEVNTHYQDDILGIDWDDLNEFPKTKEWLEETYGTEIKKYSSFAINAT